MNRRFLIAAGAALFLAGVAPATRGSAQGQDEVDVRMTPAPRRAVVLFDGKDLSRWVNRKDGKPAGWKVENGYAEIVPGNGDIITTDQFIDFRLHLEFWLPLMADKTGQARANSGVYMQGRYEVQILDSYGLQSKDNDCGGIYKVAAPLKNACKKPEHWQSYDVTFHAPRVDDQGKPAEKGWITVLHNGVTIHDKQPFDAMVTTSGLPGDFGKPGPILLQDHGNKIRFRNIWIVPARANRK